MACRVIPIRREVQRRLDRPALTLSDQIATVIIARWGVPPTPENVDAISQACAVPIAQLQILAANLPRWICTDSAAAPVGHRIQLA